MSFAFGSGEIALPTLTPPRCPETSRVWLIVELSRSLILATGSTLSLDITMHNQEHQHAVSRHHNRNPLLKL